MQCMVCNREKAEYQCAMCKKRICHGCGKEYLGQPYCLACLKVKCAECGSEAYTYRCARCGRDFCYDCNQWALITACSFVQRDLC